MAKMAADWRAVGSGGSDASGEMMAVPIDDNAGDVIDDDDPTATVLAVQTERVLSDIAALDAFEVAYNPFHPAAMHPSYAAIPRLFSATSAPETRVHGILRNLAHAVRERRKAAEAVPEDDLAFLRALLGGCEPSGPMWLALPCTHFTAPSCPVFTCTTLTHPTCVLSLRHPL